tara:strand:+ start:4468 stop:5019 length:552 start_codon:yes stop_codon:yes gene_type:complete
LSKKLNNFIKKYESNFVSILKKIQKKDILNLCNQILDVKKKKSKIMIFGNGAGASIASHFANDLTNTSGIRAMSYDNTAQITCLSNDYLFQNWVKKIINFYANNNDLVILLSASGNSKNMINAAKFCKKKKINYFSITGFKKQNKLNLNSSNKIWINSLSYNYVEMSQLFILLSIVDFFNKNN